MIDDAFVILRLQDCGSTLCSTCDPELCESWCNALEVADLATKSEAVLDLNQNSVGELGKLSLGAYAINESNSSLPLLFQAQNWDLVAVIVGCLNAIAITRMYVSFESHTEELASLLFDAGAYTTNSTSQQNPIVVHSDNGGAYIIFATATSGMYKAQLSGKILDKQPHYAQKDIKGAEDVFIVRIDENGEKQYATYFGGSGTRKRTDFPTSSSQSEICKRASAMIAW